MNQNLIEKIHSLSLQYETADFLVKDPSQFMHRYSDVRNQEAAAFIAANLAFGRRDQILSHVEQILKAAGPSPVDWILSEGYKDFFPENNSSFYRMYTNKDMLCFFDGLKLIFSSDKTAGDFFCKSWKEECCRAGEFVYLHFVIEKFFDGKTALIPRSRNSSAKKINMMLRWLVRDNSPVDLGLWKWYDKKNLLMPLDTHVMSQAEKMGILSSKSASFKTAVELTKKMSAVFPDDPVRADFALFGSGIEGF